MGLCFGISLPPRSLLSTNDGLAEEMVSRLIVCSAKPAMNLQTGSAMLIIALVLFPQASELRWFTARVLTANHPRLGAVRDDHRDR